MAAVCQCSEELRVIPHRRSQSAVRRDGLRPECGTRRAPRTHIHRRRFFLGAWRDVASCCALSIGQRRQGQPWRGPASSKMTVRNQRLTADRTLARFRVSGSLAQLLPTQRRFWLGRNLAQAAIRLVEMTVLIAAVQSVAAHCLKAAWRNMLQQPPQRDD